MIPELGHFALALAVALAAAQAVLPLVGAHRRDARLMAAAPALAIGQLLALATAYGCLIWSAVVDDFSVFNVAENSSSTEAADLQDHRHVGEPRGVHPAVVPDPGVLRRRGGGVRP